MFSKVLTKLIDEAIFPAMALVSAKVIGTIFAVRYFNVAVSDTSSFLSLYISDKANFILVNSYSNLFMYLVVFAGALVFLVRSRWFHDTHITPPFAAKIFSLRLGNFIKTSLEVFSEGTIWLSYSYLMTLILAVQVYFGIVFPYILGLSVVLSLFLTLIFVSDVDREMV